MIWRFISHHDLEHMKSRFIDLSCVLSLICSLSACKKADPVEAPGDSAESASSAETAAASSATAKTPADSATGVLLEMKWPVGNRYVYRMDVEQHSTNHIPQMPRPMQQTVVSATTYAMSVLKETEGGGRELEMEFLANEMEMTMGEQVIVSFDSKEKGEATGVQGMFAAPYRKMVGSKVRLLLNAAGQVDKVLNLDEWLNSLTADLQGATREMISAQFNEAYLRQLAGLGRDLPPTPVDVGDSWPVKTELPGGPLGTIVMDTQVTLERMEEHDGRSCAVLQSVGGFKGSGGEQPTGPAGMSNVSIEQGKLTGKSWFDPELGAVVESVSDQFMHLTGQMPGAAGPGAQAPKFTSDIAQQIQFKLVESGKVGE